MSARAWFLIALAALVLSLSARGAVAAEPSGASPPAAAAQPAGQAPIDSLSQDTPRRALERFLTHTRAGRYDRAAADLELGAQAWNGTLLARKLAAVLERHLNVDEVLGKISDAPAGDTNDGSASQDQIGRVPGELGMEPVLVQRIWRSQTEARWAFSGSTVERVSLWYESLPDRWMQEHLPEAMLSHGPLGIMVWQFLALPIFLVIGLICGVVLAVISHAVLLTLLARVKAQWDAALVERLHPPQRVIMTFLVIDWLVSSLYLMPRAERPVRALVQIGLLFGIFWGLWRGLDLVADYLRNSPWVKARPGLLGFIPLGHRLTDILVFALFAALVLQTLGFSVASLVAGLGLGGLALALAAQKTMEHLFGGVTLSLDQPMRVGDHIKAGDLQGTVEHIGLRSTRIRTADRTLITIPNGKLADMQIETYAARDRMRLAMTINAVYSLRAQGLRKLREALLKCLAAHPKAVAELTRVYFSNFTDTALNIEFTAWFQTTDQTEFQDIRQEVLLNLLEVLEQHGATTAFSKPAAPAK
ncbi:MAG: mechanosensitive ion channel family protein [Polyangia bacterium]